MITEANFINLANNVSGSGLLNTGKDNFALAKELAKQTAIGFAEWIEVNSFSFYHNKVWSKFFERDKKYTTEQLYSLYIESLNK